MRLLALLFVLCALTAGAVSTRLLRDVRRMRDRRSQPLPTAFLEVADGVSVETLAGSDMGYVDATGTHAKFTSPFGLAVAPDGSLYEADYAGHRIRRISPEGVVTTIAGSGKQGFVDGDGTDAQFYYPAGVAVDQDYTVYVTDLHNHAIRAISPTGAVTTLAGSGVAGDADGQGDKAQFNYPYDLALGPDRTLYVSDFGNNKIRKVALNGFVSTLAGGVAGSADGSGAHAKFDAPWGIAVGPAGTASDYAIYVNDYKNNRVRRIAPHTGAVTTIAGSGNKGNRNGDAAKAEFNNLIGIAVAKDGTIYVADEGSSTIRRIAGGFVSVLAGTGQAGFADGPVQEAQFSSLRGLALDPGSPDSGTTLYIADDLNYKIRKINLPYIGFDSQTSNVIGEEARKVASKVAQDVGTKAGTDAGIKAGASEASRLTEEAMQKATELAKAGFAKELQDVTANAAAKAAVDLAAVEAQKVAKAETDAQALRIADLAKKAAAEIAGQTAKDAAQIAASEIAEKTAVDTATRTAEAVARKVAEEQTAKTAESMAQAVSQKASEQAVPQIVEIGRKAAYEAAENAGKNEALQTVMQEAEKIRLASQDAAAAKAATVAKEISADEAESVAKDVATRLLKDASDNAAAAGKLAGALGARDEASKVAQEVGKAAGIEGGRQAGAEIAKTIAAVEARQAVTKEKAQITEIASTAARPIAEQVARVVARKELAKAQADAASVATRVAQEQAAQISDQIAKLEAEKAVEAAYRAALVADAELEKRTADTVKQMAADAIKEALKKRQEEDVLFRKRVDDRLHHLEKAAREIEDYLIPPRAATIIPGPGDRPPASFQFAEAHGQAQPDAKKPFDPLTDFDWKNAKSPTIFNFGKNADDVLEEEHSAAEEHKAAAADAASELRFAAVSSSAKTSSGNSNSKSGKSEDTDMITVSLPHPAEATVPVSAHLADNPIVRKLQSDVAVARKMTADTVKARNVDLTFGGKLKPAKIISFTEESSQATKRAPTTRTFKSEVKARSHPQARQAPDWMKGGFARPGWHEDQKNKEL